MTNRLVLLTVILAAMGFADVSAQECIPGAPKTPEQTARRREGLRATRTINNLEANQPGSRTKAYLPQVDLPTSPFAAKQTGPEADWFSRLNFSPDAELLPGWQFTLDVTAEGYWFMLKDKTDPCGFAFVSNQGGLIYTAEPIR